MGTDLLSTNSVFLLLEQQISANRLLYLSSAFIRTSGLNDTLRPEMETTCFFETVNFQRFATADVSTSVPMFMD
jgi:hypothetical protein